jgi:hypothetical protein
MRVIDHGPQAWFLLKEEERYFLDARVSRSAVDFSVLVELDPQEYREYHVMGKVFLHYLAARIHHFTDEYLSRDLTGSMEGTVAQAIEAWRATGS